MYNGYKNYETWATNMWFSNDPGLEEAIREYAKEVEYDVPTIAQYLQELLEDLLTQERDFEYGLFSDLLNSAMDEIDWYEIAQHWTDEE